MIGSIYIFFFFDFFAFLIFLSSLTDVSEESRATAGVDYSTTGEVRYCYDAHVMMREVALAGN